jgi:hypothetical protein
LCQLRRHGFQSHLPVRLQPGWYHFRHLAEEAQNLDCSKFWSRLWSQTPAAAIYQLSTRDHAVDDDDHELLHQQLVSCWKLQKNTEEGN